MELQKSFEAEVLGVSEERPVLVDFWAPWCGPCQVLGPIIEEIATEKKDQLEIIKVNVDHHQNLATEYGVRGIPHVTLFYKGKAIGSFSGVRSKYQILDWLDEHMPSKEKDEWVGLREKWGSVPDESAIPPLKRFVQMYPEHEEAKILLARHLAFFNPQEAVGYIEEVKMESPQFSRAQQIRKIHEYHDHPVYQNFQKTYLDQGLLNAFKDLNDKVLSSGEEEKEVIEKIGVALHSIIESNDTDLHKVRRVFDMYTNA